MFIMETTKITELLQEYSRQLGTKREEVRCLHQCISKLKAKIALQILNSGGLIGWDDRRQVLMNYPNIKLVEVVEHKAYKLA